MQSNSNLTNVIIERIKANPQQRITFAEYMDMALYHPESGYYSTQALNLGKSGDFFTSVHLGADFGEMLAVQFAQIWQILGKPTPFTLVEMGAGQGHLAKDILNYLQQKHEDLFTGLEYIIVEKSASLRKLQQQSLDNFREKIKQELNQELNHNVKLRWCNLEEIEDSSVVGCFFSNELVDAFPVHQVILSAGKLKEIYIGLPEKSHIPDAKDSPDFVEIIDEPSTLKLSEYFRLDEIDISNYPDQYRSEVNLAAIDWLTLLSKKLQRGYILTIDYGYPAIRYYNPRRNQGTLQCYYQHKRHDNPYILVGQQDITTHVDFTALERWGECCGLDKVGFTQQALFLMSLGLGERISSLSESKLPLLEMLRRRDSLHQLLDPLGVGGFGVLVQSKGLSIAEAAESLTGFVIPE
ncbi:MAG: class I SAM-dependent methyltransferase [Methylacidiphilales bacterium]|nr:class I SAM-dependent methyltransferase [Candidatus Methylacidiphilales bacterium]NJR18344.1 class I SAM-dependent methyltransferase [Calothrix sp. CSU_2_0]